MAANPMLNTKTAALADRKAGMRSRCSSTSGRSWCEQRHKNQAIATAAPPSRAMTPAEDQPQVGPSTRPPVSPPIPAVSSTTPRRSGSRSLSRAGGCGNTRAPATSAAAPIGRLTRNTHRQSSWTSRPPATGPRAAETPPTAAQARTRPGRLSGGVAASSSASEVGISAAAPAACTTRAATRTARSGAAAQAADASVKIMIPARNTRRCPVRSPSRPAGTSRAANTMA